MISSPLIWGSGLAEVMQFSHAGKQSEKNAFSNFLFFSAFVQSSPSPLKNPSVLQQISCTYVVFSVPHMKVKKVTPSTDPESPILYCANKAVLPTVFSCSSQHDLCHLSLCFVFVFFHSCHAVHLQWNRNAEMQRAELREREKREANALFFIVDKVTFL